MPASFKAYGNSFAVPALFLKMFPSWFVGVAFAAIAIGALVPAAIMSIATANLFTRNIYREYFAPDCAPARESQVAKIVSMVVKVGALFFIIGVPTKYAINLQLLGGIWIIQTLPAVLIGLYTRWLHPRRCSIGWAIGIGAGTAMMASLGFAKAIYPLHIFGVTIPCYAAFSALVLNVAISVVLSALFNAFARGERADTTLAEDYALTEPAGDILLGALVVGRGENLFRRAEFHQLAQIHEGGVVGRARGLLHIVGHDDDGVIVGQFVDQFLDLGGRNRIERRAGLVQQDHFRLASPPCARCRAAAAGRPKGSGPKR